MIHFELEPLHNDGNLLQCAACYQFKGETQLDLHTHVMMKCREFSRLQTGDAFLIEEKEEEPYPQALGGDDECPADLQVRLSVYDAMLESAEAAMLVDELDREMEEMAIAMERSLQDFNE